MRKILLCLAAALAVAGTCRAQYEDGKSWKWMFPPAFEDARAFGEDFAAVKADGRWGLVNRSREWLIGPVFEDVYGFYSGGLVAVKRDGLWGYADKYGAIVIPATFSRAGIFSGGVAEVMLPGGKKPCYIDMRGEFVSRPKGYSAPAPDAVIDSGVVLKRDAVSGRYGYVDGGGEWVIDPVFEAGTRYDGFAMVRLDGKWGCVSLKGEHSKAGMWGSPKEPDKKR